MRGGTDAYQVIITPLVALTMKLAVSVETFYGPTVINSIAFLLHVSRSHQSCSSNASVSLLRSLADRCANV